MFPSDTHISELYRCCPCFRFTAAAPSPSSPHISAAQGHVPRAKPQSTHGARTVACHSGELTTMVAKPHSRDKTDHEGRDWQRTHRASAGAGKKASSGEGGISPWWRRLLQRQRQRRALLATERRQVPREQPVTIPTLMQQRRQTAVSRVSARGQVASRRSSCGLVCKDALGLREWRPSPQQVAAQVCVSMQRARGLPVRYC